MKTHIEIAEAVAGGRYVAGRTVTEHTRLIAFDAVTKALELYRIELVREFSAAILETQAEIEESTAADGMDPVFDARDNAGDLLGQIHTALMGTSADGTGVSA